MLLLCLVLSFSYSTEATASKTQAQAQTKRHLEVSSSVVHREAATETGKKVAAHIRSASKKTKELRTAGNVKSSMRIPSQGFGIDALQIAVIDAQSKLTGNEAERELIHANLKRFEDSTASKQEIDAKAKVVTKETGSSAMATMLGKMWGELRKFEAPAFRKNMDAELSVLDADKKDLEAKLEIAQENLQKAKDKAAIAAAKREAAGETEETEAPKSEAADADADKTMSARETRKALDDNMEAIEGKKASAQETSNALDDNMDALDKAYDEHGSSDDANDLGLLQSKVTSTPKSWSSWTDSFTSVQYNVWKLPPSYWYHHLLTMLAYLGTFVLLAYLYQQAKDHYFPKFFTLEPRPELLPRSEDFTFGICECFSNTNLCILGCCCPFMKWSDTMDRHGFLSYWKAFAIACVCLFLHTFTLGSTDILLVLVGIFYRQALRKKLQIESGTPKTLCCDCLVWSCCQPCAIIQEAHEEVVQRGTLQEEV